jgi:DNA polymerase III epsilon subunit-like protein
MIVFDTETTGLIKPEDCSIHLQPHITEFSGLQVDDNFFIQNQVDTFVKPPIPIPDFCTRLNGISDETVADAPDFLDIYPQLVALFLGETTVVGHNVTFDLGVLYFELKRHDLEFKFPWPQKWICTVEKSMPIEGHRLTLSRLYQIATGNTHEGAHRAKQDVRATLTCYQFLLRKGLIT